MGIAAIQLAVGRSVGGDREDATLIVLRGPGPRTAPGTRPGAVDVQTGDATFVLDVPSLALYVPGGGLAPIGPFIISPTGLLALAVAGAPARPCRIHVRRGERSAQRRAARGGARRGKRGFRRARLLRHGPRGSPPSYRSQLRRDRRPAGQPLRRQGPTPALVPDPHAYFLWTILATGAFARHANPHNGPWPRLTSRFGSSPATRDAPRARSSRRRSLSGRERLDFPAAAITDRNGLYAAMPFTDACFSGVQPIIGTMLAVARPGTGGIGTTAPNRPCLDWLRALRPERTEAMTICAPSFPPPISGARSRSPRMSETIEALDGPARTVRSR